MTNKLYRSKIQKVIGGVCGGLAEYFDVDPVFIRALFILLLVAGGSGFLLYILLWILIPQKPLVFSKEQQFANVNSKFNTSNNFEAFYNSSCDNETINRAAELKFEEEQNKRKNNFGYLLIATGLIIFLYNYIPSISFSVWAPILLISLGVYKLYKSKSKSKQENIF